MTLDNQDRREQARRMKRDGKTYREIGVVMGVGRQQAQNLVAPPRPMLRLMARKAGGCCQICGRRARVLQGHHENYNGDPTIFVCTTCHGRLEAGKMSIAELKQDPHKLTQREMALYDVIVDYKRANDGCAPDHRELMALADISSTSVVAHYLDHLERAGLITRRQGSRQIHVRGGQWTLNS